MQTISEYKDIGKWVKSERKIHNMTQSELAVATGYSNVYISRIEKGVDLPRLQVVEDICTAFGYKMFIGVEKDGCD